MEKGTFELIHLGGLTIGRATYQPGWRWSEHVGPQLGQARCVVELRAGELFYTPPIPHDSWVVGDEPYVSLHFLGAGYNAFHGRISHTALAAGHWTSLDRGCAAHRGFIVYSRGVIRDSM